MSTIERMPVITLHQPWASFIAWGWKTIESRTHPRLASLAGKRFYLHAGKAWDPNCVEGAGAALRWMSREQVEQTMNQAFGIRGAIIALCHAGEHRLLSTVDSSAAMIDCGVNSPQRWGLHIEWTSKLLLGTTPAKGKQGIWYFP